MTDVGEDVEKRQPFYTVGRKARWYGHSGKTVWRFLKMLKIELPYDLAITVLGIYPKDINVGI